MNKRRASYIFGTLFLILAIGIAIATDWAYREYGVLDFNLLLFHMNVPLEGTNMSPFVNIIILVAVASPLLALIFLAAAVRSDDKRCLVLGIGKLKIRFALDIWHRHYLLLTGLILIVSMAVNFHMLGVDRYIISRMSPSELYDEKYVAPEEAKVTFPEKKRNLIYIFTESMENTFASPDVGGAEYANYIPELTELQLENINFTAKNNHLNGGVSSYGSTWTVGGIVAQTAGTPLIMPTADSSNDMDKFATFMPGAYTLGDMLEREGYEQYFLMGSDAAFGGRDHYLSQHGGYNIEDYYYAIDSGWIAPDYHVFWGYEDAKLFEFAKNELTRLGNGNNPFNFTMLTVDTHFTDGYLCSKCGNTFDNQYANVIACSGRQISEFVEWIKAQPFYENTTIVICGDHPTMDTDYMQRTCADIDNYQRKTYTAIINPACEYELHYDREFATFDMYPTTVAALGAEIEGDRLGLGTNLFADTPTLVEEYGLDYVDEELKKHSSYYNKYIMNYK